MLRTSLPEKEMYWVPEDDLATEVLVPAFASSDSVECMVGFFDSGAFATVAPGLAAFINERAGQMRFLISPNLSAEDVDALVKGQAEPEDVLTKALEFLVGERGEFLASAVGRHQYDCLAYLVATGRLEIRVVLVPGALFHPKTWIFRDAEDAFMVHGSGNSTQPGITRNIEHMTLEGSWRSRSSISRIETMAAKFEALWEDDVLYSKTFSLPEIIERQLLVRGSNIEEPTIADFWTAWRDENEEVGSPGGAEEAPKGESAVPSQALAIPTGLPWGADNWSHQKDAVEAWEENGRRGVLSMATGSGKTVTALVAATRLQNSLDEPLLIVVSVPTRPLAEQWIEEIAQFSVKARDSSKWSEALRSLRFGAAQTECLVVTNNFVRDSAFLAFLEQAAPQVPILFIADEVHSLASDKFVENQKNFDPIPYRLGLSATPDKFSVDQTDAIWDYFGEVVYDFPLRSAIAAGCLVRYEYVVIPVELDSAEIDMYESLTRQLGRATGLPPADRSLATARIAAKRHGVIEMAAAKIPALRNTLRKHASRGDFRQALIYTSAKSPDQLREVAAFMNEDRYFHHRVTDAESGNSVQVREFLRQLASGQLQAITCKKVLDEGISVPAVRRAYLVSSSASKREWVQRRGRILRHSPGKDRAILFDFAVLPGAGASDATSRGIRKSESERIREFAADAAWGGPEALALLG